MSCLLGKDRDIFFPKLSEQLNLTKFSDIATRYLKYRGYQVQECKSEKEAREFALRLTEDKKWPCYFFKSDTTGEKDFEEFYVQGEVIDLTQYNNIGIVQNLEYESKNLLINFEDEILLMRNKNSWSKKEILDLFIKVLPNFLHEEKGKYLDEKM